MSLQDQDLISILDTIEGGLDLDGVAKKFNQETLSPLLMELDETIRVDMATERNLGRISSLMS